MDSKSLTEKLLGGTDLDAAEITTALAGMLDGSWGAASSGAFLAALRAKGEQPAELAAAAKFLLQQCVPVTLPAPAQVLDTAGTGGDGQATFNISTAAAFVAAACGVRVAKHGNRALSGKCGSSDLLAALGVNLELPPERLAEIQAATGICFMFAPLHHPALKAVGPIRVELGIRTVFNLLGPLANPAGAGLRLAGVFAPQWLVPYAKALQGLGATRVVVAHAAGLDEFSVAAPTQYAVLADGEVSEHRITPAEAGVGQHELDQLRVASIEEATAMFNSVIDGKESAALDACLLNAGAALFAAGHVEDIPAGIVAAREAISSGKVRAKVDQFVTATQA